jgi:periplasmic protein TonB
MTLETRPALTSSIGTLQCCLVEADPASERRARLIKRRALFVSIAFQSVVITALILYPLLAKSERISLKNMTPIPPYQAVHHHAATRPAAPVTQQRFHACMVCPTAPLRPIRPTDPAPPSDPIEPDGPDVPGIPHSGVDHSIGAAPPPLPPRQIDRPVVRERRHVSELVQMARLDHRVEPVYPALSKQMHLEGQVELHAIIGTDGSIRSLTAVNGHPLFIQSAMDAVRQWHYQPTILNGTPVEVETTITVIYKMNH